MVACAWSRVLPLLISSSLLLVACSDAMAPPDQEEAPRDLTVKPPPDDLRMPPDLIGFCTSDKDCGGAAGSCCGSRCVDPMSDVMNCGACGMPCSGGRTCCTGRCVFLDNDTANCGACGMGCQVTNGKPSCNKGMCVLGSCDNGWSDCNASLADGCETQSSGDVKNCGGCGM